MTIVAKDSTPVMIQSPLETSKEFANATSKVAMLRLQLVTILKESKEKDIDFWMQTLAENEVLTGMQQGVVSRQRIETADVQRKEATRKMQEQMAVILEKIHEALEADTSEDDKTWGWVAAIAEMVGALILVGICVGLTIASGGAGAPLIALAAIMLVTASMSVADMAVKESGDTETNVSFGGMIDAIVDLQEANPDSPFGIIVLRTNADGVCVDKEGNIIDDPRIGKSDTTWVMTEQEEADWKQGWSITVNLMVIIAMLALGGLPEGAGKLAADGPKIGKLASSIAADAAMTVSQALTATSAAISSAMSIYDGVMQRKLAEIKADTDRARAQKAFYEMAVKEITTRLSLIMDDMRNLSEHVNENFKAVSNLIRSSAEARMNTVQKILS